jgi:hypothetical protein
VKAYVKIEVKFHAFLTSALDKGGWEVSFKLHEETRQYLKLNGHTNFLFINCRGLRHNRPIICHLKNTSHKWKTQFTRII